MSGTARPWRAWPGWRWADSLFARMLLVNLAVALMVLLLFLALLVQAQSQAQARTTAPVWAAALRPLLGGPLALPADRAVVTTVRLLPGPPLGDATQFPFHRLREMAAELRQAGVPVQSIRVSGTTGSAVTWLALDQGGRLTWVGVQNELEGADLRLRGLLGLAISVLGILAAAWWLSQRVARPLADLRRTMARFFADGQPPAPPAPGAATELRELAALFADLARERQALELQRRTMLAGISHDLRSPLTRIRLAAELLPEATGVAPRRDAIVRNVALADRLLGSFIDLARAEDEPLRDRVDLVCLAARLARSEPDLAPAALPVAPLWLQPASAVALERALRNLVDNARHHGRAPVELSLARDGDWAVLAVRDHGEGIAPQDRAAMLQPFMRGDASRHTPGTGLGLAIVQCTARRHGGQLLLEGSQPGLRASLRLPLAPATADSPARPHTIL